MAITAGTLNQADVAYTSAIFYFDLELKVGNWLAHLVREKGGKDDEWILWSRLRIDMGGDAFDGRDPKHFLVTRLQAKSEPAALAEAKKAAERAQREGFRMVEEGLRKMLGKTLGRSKPEESIHILHVRSSRVEDVVRAMERESYAHFKFIETPNEPSNESSNEPAKEGG